MTKNTTTPNRPIHKVRIAGVTAAIWQHEAKDGQGSRYTVTVEKSYKKGDGTWAQTGHFSVMDLLSLAKAADLAHTRIIQQVSDEE